MDVTYDPAVSDVDLDRLARLLPDLVAAAVDCPEEPWLGPAEVGDIEIRFREKSRHDVGDLRVVVEVRTKWDGESPRRSATEGQRRPRWPVGAQPQADRCLADPRRRRVESDLSPPSAHTGDSPNAGSVRCSR